MASTPFSPAFMQIGVLTHNYPRYRGDFVGNFIEASCRELARQGQRVTVLAPFDPAYDRPLREPFGEGRVEIDHPESLFEKFLCYCIPASGKLM